MLQWKHSAQDSLTVSIVTPTIRLDTKKPTDDVSWKQHRGRAGGLTSSERDHSAAGVGSFLPWVRAIYLGLPRLDSTKQVEATKIHSLQWTLMINKFSFSLVRNILLYYTLCLSLCFGPQSTSDILTTCAPNPHPVLLHILPAPAKAPSHSTGMTGCLEPGESRGLCPPCSLSYSHHLTNDFCQRIPNVCLEMGRKEGKERKERERKHTN